MKKAAIWMALSLACALSPAAAAEPALQLLVAVLQPGGLLPPHAACSGKNVVCIDAPPYWLKANVSATLFGPQAPAYLEINASDHFGMGHFMHFGGASLVLVRTDGERSTMLRNRVTRLVANKSGELFLVRWQESFPGWVSCMIDGAQEELAESDFDDERMVIAPEDFESAGVDQAPGHFRRTAQGAMPRYGIRMQRLAEHISKRTRAGLPFNCEAPLPQ